MEFPFFPVGVQDFIFWNSISIWTCLYQLVESTELHVSGMLNQAGSTSPSIFFHSIIHGLCDKVNWIVDGSKQRWNLFLKITIIFSPSPPSLEQSLSIFQTCVHYNGLHVWVEESSENREGKKQLFLRTCLFSPLNFSVFLPQAFTILNITNMILLWASQVIQNIFLYL